MKIKPAPSKEILEKVINDLKLLDKCATYFNCSTQLIRKWVRYYNINYDFSKNAVLPEIISKRGITNTLNHQKQIKCKLCNKEIIVLNNSKIKFCSLDCYYEFKKLQPKQHKLCICNYCGKDIWKPQSLIGVRNFCNYDCTINYRKNKSYETLYGIDKANIIKQKIAVKTKLNNEYNPVYFTKPHQILKHAMIDANIYTGFTTNKLVDYWEIDELNEDKKICLEINGNYWHNLPNVKIKDIRKLEYLKNKGYIVITIWENEIYENIELCIKKIKNYL